MERKLTLFLQKFYKNQTNNKTKMRMLSLQNLWTYPKGLYVNAFIHIFLLIIFVTDKNLSSSVSRCLRKLLTWEENNLRHTCTVLHTHSYVLKDTGLSLGAGSTLVKRPRIVAELWYSPSPEQTEHIQNICTNTSISFRS